MLQILLTILLVAATGTAAFADHPSIGFGADAAGAIWTPQPDVLPRGQLAASLGAEYLRPKRFSDAELAGMAGNHIHAHSVDAVLTTTLGASYGVSDALTLSFRLPFVRRDNVRAGTHTHGGGGPVNGSDHLGNAAGIGDAALLGKYRFFSRDGASAAVMLGAKLPTGRTDVSGAGQRLETEHQPGSGSLDALAGFAASKNFGAVRVDAGALYAVAGEGALQTDLGDRLQYGAGLSYRLGGAAHDHGHAQHRHRAVDLVLEFTGEWAGKQTIGGTREEHSGGHLLFLAPGARYVPGSGWAAHLSVGVPVAGSLGRGHADMNYKVSAGIVRGF